jgi:hypothetical protein
MPDQEAIFENIRKLRGMGLTDQDVIMELESMGILKTQAERWVRQSEHLEEMEKNDYSRTPTATTTTQTTPVSMPPKPEPKPTYNSPQPDTSIERLWEKGILATVDTKLSQMEKLKGEIDDVIEAKVNEHYNVMEKKLEALFDAQRELFRFKMDAQLDSKVKDVDDILNQKIEEIRKINLTTQEDLQRIKGQKMLITDLMADFTTKSEQLEETKRVILDDVGKKLEELQEKVDELISKTDERLSEVERRATKTLELEEKITQGLADQVEAQANTILEGRVKDLRQEIKDEIIQLKKLGADLASKDIQSTLQEFLLANQEMKQTKKEIDGIVQKKTSEIDAALDKKMLDVDKIVNTKMETIVAMKEKEFFKKVEDQAGDMNKTQRDLGQKIVEAETKIQNLDGYTKQFLETLKKANMEREDQTALFRKKMEEFETKADQKMILLESRTRQVDIVVSQLTELINQWKTQMETMQARNAASAPSTPTPSQPPEKKQGFGFFGK